MTKVQSPLIGNALRQALGLDAAGAMPMDADTTIVPVAVVADVREAIQQAQTSAWHYSFISPAVAAEYPYVSCEWLSGSLPRPYRLLVDKVTIWSPTAQPFWIGLTQSPPAITLRGLPIRKQSSLLPASLAGRVGYGTTSTAPGSFITLAYISRLVANERVEVTFPDPVILDREGSACVVMANQVNTELYASFEWREEMRQ